MRAEQLERYRDEVTRIVIMHGGTIDDADLFCEQRGVEDWCAQFTSGISEVRKFMTSPGAFVAYCLDSFQTGGLEGRCSEPIEQEAAERQRGFETIEEGE